MSIQDLGIKTTERKKVAKELTQFLASSYMLYVKTHNYHWNVTGVLFQPLHGIFEEQYKALAPALDVIAERIRALDYRAPGTFREFLELSHIAEDEPNLVPEAEMMVSTLQSDHEKISAVGRKLIKTAEDADDNATADLITKQLEFHEKTAWMLRSFLAPRTDVTPALRVQANN